LAAASATLVEAAASYQDDHMAFKIERPSDLDGLSAVVSTSRSLKRSNSTAARKCARLEPTPATED
jgi:hypothetical protein